MIETLEIQKRRMELLKLMHSLDGEEKLEEIYRACFAPGQVPSPDEERIETILKHEFPEDRPAP